MSGSAGESESESELTAALRRFVKQHHQMVTPGVASALAHVAKQHQQMVTQILTPGVASALATFAKQHQQMMTRALTARAGLVKRRQQMAESATQYSQQVALASADSALASWVMVQAFAFVLLVEMLLIGWSLAAAVSPEARTNT